MYLTIHGDDYVAVSEDILVATGVMHERGPGAYVENEHGILLATAVQYELPEDIQSGPPRIVSGGGEPHFLFHSFLSRNSQASKKGPKGDRR
jgi:hypothetical protein